MTRYGEKLVTAFHTHLDVSSPDISDTAMMVAGLLVARPSSKTRQEVVYNNDNSDNINDNNNNTMNNNIKVEYHGDKRSVIRAEPRFPDRPAFDLVAIVDPVSRGAQKVVPVLLVLQQVLNARVRLFMNCVDKHSEMPNKSYFR